MSDERPGVWVAYYGDSSGVMPFATEIDALREAVKSSRQVLFVPYGMDLLDAEREARK